jgi:hypothetical protein
LPEESATTSPVKTRITNTTIPKVYEAFFRPDGNALLIRTLKDDSDLVENTSLTLTAPIPVAGATSTEFFHSISSTPIEVSASSIAVGVGNNLFMSIKSPSGIAASAFDGSGRRMILSSAFSDWQLTTIGNILLAQSKASFLAGGHAYFVNPSSGALTKIVGPLNGLVATSNPSGSRVAYSYSEGSRTRLFALSLPNREVKEITPATFAEKCIWSPSRVSTIFCAVPSENISSGEPDRWYAGETHYSDRIWIFDTSVDIAQVLAEPKQSMQTDIDVFDLKISSGENFLIFTNKNDLSLWALRLGEGL